MADAERIDIGIIFWEPVPNQATIHNGKPGVRAVFDALRGFIEGEKLLEDPLIRLELGERVRAIREGREKVEGPCKLALVGNLEFYLTKEEGR